jgi:hypothetical protein
MCTDNRQDPEVVTRHVCQLTKAAGHCPSQAAMVFIKAIATVCREAEARGDKVELDFFRDRVGTALEEMRLAIASGDVEKATTAFSLADDAPQRVM